MWTARVLVGSGVRAGSTAARPCNGMQFVQGLVRSRGVHVHIRHVDYLTLPIGLASIGLRDLRQVPRQPVRSRS